MVWQRCALNHTFSEIAANFCVDQATVKRIIDLFETTGDVCKRPYPKHRLQKVLSPMAEMIVLTNVVQQPGINLREVHTQLKEYGIEVSESTICRSLHKSGFSYPRMTLTAKQRDEDTRMTFEYDVSVYDPEILVLLMKLVLIGEIF